MQAANGNTIYARTSQRNTFTMGADGPCLYTVHSLCKGPGCRLCCMQRAHYDTFVNAATFYMIPHSSCYHLCTYQWSVIDKLISLSLELAYLLHYSLRERSWRTATRPYGHVTRPVPACTASFNPRQKWQEIRTFAISCAYLSRYLAKCNLERRPYGIQV